MIPWREREYPTRRQRMEIAARALTAPLLLIRGGRSEVVSEEGAREFLALVPEAEYAVIEGAGHMIAGDRNDSFGHAAGPFLERLRARM
jgi:pimeloyl-ACP methyl ester carboxylesterase